MLYLDWLLFFVNNKHRVNPNRQDRIAHLAFGACEHGMPACMQGILPLLTVLQPAAAQPDF